MKALSIKQPWASLIAHGIKDIENRTWKTNFRGKIYIHVSGVPSGRITKLLTESQLDAIFERTDLRFLDTTLIKSAIIGEVDIVDCVINHPSIWAEKTFMYEYDEESGEKPIGKPIYNWVLANPVLYEKPILNVKGKLSFWLPDTDIIECIGCSNKFDSETMCQDESEEHFCNECWEELSPIMVQEAKENKYL